MILKAMMQFRLTLRIHPRFAAGDQFQATYTQVRVSIPKVTEQLADTYLENNDEQKKLLAEARDEYEKVWEAYPKFIAGLKSCVYAARCSYKLGDNKKALDLLNEEFILGDNSILKPIKLESYLLASDCWAASKKYPYIASHRDFRAGGQFVK